MSASARSQFEYLDEYDYYSFDQEKYLLAGHGGKQRNKREVMLNSNRPDPCGNVRKITAKLQNMEHNKRVHAK